MKKLKKTIYLLLIRFFNVITIKNKKDEITLLMTFSDDIIPLLNKLIENYTINLIYDPKYESIVQQYNCNKVSLSLSNSFHHIKCLSRSKVIVIDTYYLMLGAYRKKNQTVIQTWHAAGALKQFGLEDLSIDQKDKKLISGYKKVYHATDYYLTASDEMGEIFCRSLDARQDQLLKFGLPRMDKYFPLTHTAEKIIAYVPTYRDYEEHSPFNVQQIQQAFPAYRVIVKLHPSLGRSDDISVEEIMKHSEFVITDYSSLAIEAALNHRKVIFFSYDEEKYARLRGLNQAYYKMSKLNKAYTNEELIERINTYQHNPVINQMWNQYNAGKSTNKTINFIEEQMR